MEIVVNMPANAKPWTPEAIERLLVAAKRMSERAVAERVGSGKFGDRRTGSHRPYEDGPHATVQTQWVVYQKNRTPDPDRNYANDWTEFYASSTLERAMHDCERFTGDGDMAFTDRETRIRLRRTIMVVEETDI